MSDDFRPGESHGFDFKAEPMTTNADDAIDAARYRWLRTRAHVHSERGQANVLAILPPWKPAGMRLVEANKMEVLDAAIDEARAVQGGPRPTAAPTTPRPAGSSTRP